MTQLPRHIVITLLNITILSIGVAPHSFGQTNPRKPGQTGPPNPASKPILHISLIGDAGYAEPANDAPIRAIGRAAREIETPELTVFLGDNIYGNGMPPAGDEDRGLAESVLDTQLKIFSEDTTMAGIFIPGNHDWDGMGEDGRASVTRQSDYIRRATGSRIRLLPDSARPGPVLVMRNDVLQVIALDSQWWLHKYDKPFYPGAATDSATQEAIADSLHWLLSEFEGKVSIILTHHPLETHGPHGGYFPVTDHIFPLRNINSWLWLPLPVLGSAYPIARASGYSEQDVT
ncbi:MAG TPA: metallophosphoesterase, partial [Bacteroidota bacterium]|nr:metallophosphoesterase [Bacteroidota bacterium]